MFGAAVSSSDRRVGSDNANHGVTPSNHGTAQQNTSCIFYSGLSRSADFVSMDGTNFVIDWTAAPATAIIVNFIAIGGSALTNYKTGIITAKTTTGNQGYTGFGFQPDGMLGFCGKWATPETFNLVTNGASVFSFLHNSSERGYVAWRSRNSANPSVARRRQSKTKAAGSLTDTGVFTEADLVSMDSDGTTWNYTTAGGTADIMYHYAFKGPQVKVGSLSQPTSTGTQSIDVGFSPKLVLLMSANDIASNDDTQLNDMQISWGAGSASNKRGCMWWGEVTGQAPTICKGDLDRTKIIKLYTVGSTPTLNAAADLDSFGSTTFVLNWTTVDSTQREILYMAIG